MATDPDEVVELTTAASRFEAEILARVLEESGIPAQVYGDAAERVGFKFDGWSPVRVAVRRKDLDAAKAALDRNREDSVDLDWTEVQTGDTSSLLPGELGAFCPACHYELSRIPSLKRCPECGADLRRRTPVSAARPWKRPWIVAIGFMGLAIVLLMWLQSMLGLLW